VANYNVDIAVAVKNLTSLDKLKRELKNLDEAYKKIGVGDKLQLKEKAALIKREIGLEEEKINKIKRRAKLEEKAADARSARLAREASLRARARAGDLDVTDPAGPDVRLRSYAEAQQKAVEAEARLRDEINKANMALDLRRQQTERIGKERRDAMVLHDRELAFEERLNDLFRRRGILTEEQMKKEDRMRKKRLNAAVTGGAFPLLFGGGFFQAAGGAAGGAISGEMFSGATVGLQVFGSLLDRVIAGLTANAAKLGRATTTAGADIDAIIESLGRVGDTSLDYIKSLDTTETKIFALQQANEELARLVGEEGVENFKKFGDQTRRLQNEMTAFFTSISASVAGLIADSGALEGTISMFEEFRLFDAAKRSAAGEGVTGTQESAMQDAFSKLEQATGKERERAFKNILKLQQKIEASALSELEIRKQQNALFIADLEQRMQMRDQEDALAEAEGKKIADRLNTGDAVTIQLQDQLSLAQATTEEETLTAEQTIRRRDLLNKVHESQKPVIEGLLDQLDAAERLGDAEEQRLNADAAKNLARQFNREVELRQASSDVAKDLLKIQFKHEDRMRAINELKDQSLKKEQKISAELLNQLEVRDRLGEFATTRTEGEIARDDLNREIALLRAKLEGKEEEFLLEEELNKLRLDTADVALGEVDVYEDLLRQIRQRKKLEEALNENLRIQKAKTAELQSVYKQIGQTIETGVVEAISAAVDKTKTLGEVAANVLRNIANQLLRMGVNQLMGAIFNPFDALMKPGGPYEGSAQFPPLTPPPPVSGEKALGGAVGAGRAYMVGERGPELFIPGAQGNIVPNNAMGSTSVVVNVDASGTEVQGNQGNADQLGRLIGQAVQAELIKQKRPGGLLTR